MESVPSYTDYLAEVRRQEARDRDRFMGTDCHPELPPTASPVDDIWFAPVADGIDIDLSGHDGDVIMDGRYVQALVAGPPISVTFRCEADAKAFERVSELLQLSIGLIQ